MGFFVASIFGEWEGIVSGGAGGYEEESVADVFTEFSVGGRWARSGGEGAAVGPVVVVVVVVAAEEGLERAFGNEGTEHWKTVSF